MKKFCLFALIFFNIQLWSQELFQKAQSAYEKANYVQAKSLLNQALIEDENNVAYRSLLGQTFARLEEWESAANINEQLVSEFPENPEYHFRYGGALGLYAKSVNKFKALTLLDDVKFHLKKAAKLDQNHIDSRWALVQLYMELPGIIGGSKSQAITYAKQLEQISPVDGALALGFIEAYDDNFALAEDHYLKAVAIGKSTTCYQKLINLYRDFNKHQSQVEASLEAYQFTNQINFILQLSELPVSKLIAIQDLRTILLSIELDSLNKDQLDKLESLKNKLSL